MMMFLWFLTSVALLQAHRTMMMFLWSLTSVALLQAHHTMMMFRWSCTSGDLWSQIMTAVDVFDFENWLHAVLCGVEPFRW